MGCLGLGWKGTKESQGVSLAFIQEDGNLTISQAAP